MLLVAAARVPNLAAARSPMGAANVGSSGILNSPATRARPGPDLVWRGGYAASVWNSGCVSGRFTDALVLYVCWYACMHSASVL